MPPVLRSLPRPRRPPRSFCLRACVTGLVMLADLAVPRPARAADLLAIATVAQTISNITNWIVGLLAAIATMFLTIGGLRYLMGGGEPGEVEKAKGALKSAAIGYMLALMAPVIVGVLKGLVGA